MLDIINDIALKKNVTVIIIHSKYVSCSDSLKSHATIIIIRYCRPNYEEFCDMSKNDDNRAAKLQINESLTEKTQEEVEFF